MSANKYMSYDNLVLYDENIKNYIDNNFAKADEPIFTGILLLMVKLKQQTYHILSAKPYY